MIVDIIKLSGIILILDIVFFNTYEQTIQCISS